MPTNKTTIALLLDTETTGTSRNDQIIDPIDYTNN